VASPGSLTNDTAPWRPVTWPGVVSSVPGTPVVTVLRWPGDAGLLEQFDHLGIPRLLLVDPDADPPALTDPLSDWIRLPAEERDVQARVSCLGLRAGRDVIVPVLDGACRLSFRGAWAPLSPIEYCLRAMWWTTSVTSPGEPTPWARPRRPRRPGCGRCPTPVSTRSRCWRTSRSTPRAGSASARVSTRCRCAWPGAGSRSAWAPRRWRPSPTARSWPATNAACIRAPRTWCWTTTSRSWSASRAPCPGRPRWPRPGRPARSATPTNGSGRRPAARWATGPAPGR
jgi:hypothetical protein